MYYDGNSGYYLRYNFETNGYEKVNSDNVVINDNSESPVTSTASSDTDTLPSDSEISQDEKIDREDLNKNEAKSAGADDDADERLSEGELSSDSPPPAKLSRKSNAKLEKKNLRKEQKRLKKELKIPCIRMVVHTSAESSAINVGTLFIITW